MLRRTLLLATALGALVGGSSLGGAISGAAATNYVACELTGSAAFASPGLVATTSRKLLFTFTGKLASCSSSDKTIRSGTAKASGTVTGTCASNKASGTYTITWNNGKLSSGSLTATGAGALTTLTTRTTSGEFAGTSGHGTLAFQTTTPQACVSPGLTKATFTGLVDSP